MRKSFKLLQLIGIIIALVLISITFVSAQDDEGESATELPELPLTSDYVYVVQTGDTLDEIAAVFDIRLACIREVNDIGTTDSDGIIRAGDEILMDTDCPAYDGQLTVEFPRDNAPGRTGDDGTYVVQPGDTLDTIGQALNMSVVEIRLLNDLPDTYVLMSGEVLTIPAEGNRTPYGQFPAIVDPDQGGGLPDGFEDADFYVVQRGDTLDTIAQAFEMSMVQLMLINELDEFDPIYPGNQLIIPAEDNRTPYGQFPAIVDPDQGGGLPDGFEDADFYVVQRGDTLDTIAQSFEMSVVELRLINDIGQYEAIYPGTQLIIPAEGNRTPYGQFPAIVDPDQGGGLPDGLEDADFYVIQPLDTIDTIAQEFEMSAVQLMLINDLDEFDPIYPGTQLIIPAEADRVPYGQFPAIVDPDQGGGLPDGFEDADFYVVQRGDTLDTIAQSFEMSVVELRLINDIGQYDAIYPGNQLIIPAEGNRTPYGQFPAIVDPDQGGGLPEGLEDADFYVVQPQDTLDTIGQELNMSVVQLRQINDIGRYEPIYPGMQLIIPAEGDRVGYGLFPAIIDPDQEAGGGVGGGFDGDIVVLQPFGTIDEIAQDLNISTRCILEFNNITNTRTIQPGTQIYIPTSCPPYGNVPASTDTTDTTTDTEEGSG